MQIEKRKLAELSLDPKNARKHNKKNLEAIKGSLTKFGQQKPIVVTKENVIIAGNGTYAAAKELGWVAIDVVVSTLDAVNQKAFALADNRSAELAEWDDDFLSESLQALSALQFDLGNIGFDEMFVKKNTPSKSDPKDDVVPEVPKNVHNVKRGQIWQLGAHRLMCGDSTSNEDVKKLMNGEKVDITFTSPPYNAGCFGFQDGKDKYGKKADDKTQLEYFKFLVTFTDIALDVSSYVFFNNQFLSGNIEALAKFIGHYASYLKDVFPWIKNTAPPNVNPGVFTNRFEVILCLEKDKKKKGFPVAWQGKYHNVIDGSTAAKDNVAADSHSATMPLYVPDFFLERLPFVKSIYEPFGGTGTTLIAAEVRQAKCFAMEMDEHYCSVIIERWQQFTGNKAQLLTT